MNALFRFVQEAVEADFQFMKCGSVLTVDLNLNCGKNSGRWKRLEMQSSENLLFLLGLQRVHMLFHFPPYTELPHHHSY